MTHAKIKRRPRWDRILIALLILGLCVGLSIGLTRLLTEQPEELDATGGDSTSGGQSGLQVSPTSAGGQVLSFTDPGVSLGGLQRHVENETNRNYAYFVLSVDADGSASERALARFDYATRTLDWLCDTPGCDHKNPACPAYFPYSFYGPYVDGDDLYTVIIDDTNDTVTLQRSDLDGGNGAALFCIEEEHYIPTLLFNQEAIVAIAGGDGKTYVYEKATGDFRQFMTLRHGDVDYVYDHYVADLVSKEGEASALVAIDLATGQERTLYEQPKDDGARRLVPPVLDGGFLYCLRDKEGEYCDFVRQSIATGEEVVLSDKAFFPDDYTASLQSGGTIADGCFVYNIAPLSDEMTEADFTRYSLDLATGAPTALPAAYGASCHRVATFADCYLVQTMTPNEDGTYTINARDFRLITREDYEAGNENYIPIQDNTL